MVRRKHVAVRDPYPEPETESEPEPEPQPEPPVETYDDEEETLGESESPGTPPSPNVSDFVFKPISPARRVSFSVAANPTSSKRKSEDDNGGDGENDKKRTRISASAPFLKVWNKEDEICLLQGMLDFHKAKGVHPSNKMGAFHEFINGKLSVDKSKVQVYEKVRRLKEKFFKHFGKDNVFSDAHDSEIFEISEKIWGCEVDEKKQLGKVADKSVKKGGKMKGASKVADETVKEGQKKGLVKVDKIAEDGEKDVDARVNEGGGDFQSKYPYLYRSFDNDRYLRDDLKMYMREKLSLIDSSKTKVWNERWKNLYKQEGELLRMKSSLMEELTDQTLDSLKQR